MSVMNMNEQQQIAIETIDGPLLILAGAGTGKTRVLTNRVAYMIENGINPYNILAITFTNKAASEMRERIDAIVGFGAENIWVSTFHSTCVRILRAHIDKLGYDNKFTIYDTDDQKTVMKEVCKRLQIDTKQLKERTLLNHISKAKDELISPVEFEMNALGDYNQKRIARVYKEYQISLKKNNALDFDDLIAKTVELFKTCPEVLEKYQDRFKYIMVDEYQDTNIAQFELIRLLSKRERNLCVVGDDDQSIYKFRGANIRNILDFEKIYPDAKVIKLEQNYRSTKTILNAANAVIANNSARKHKSLWSAMEEGRKIHFKQLDSAYSEARYIVEHIIETHSGGNFRYSDFAVLYRTNAQARAIEESCVVKGIPYHIVGGINFYSRKEIKDLIAYIKTISNGLDDLAVKRIINIPKRGIGATTISRVQEYADENNISFYNALAEAHKITTIGKSAVKLEPFVTMIQSFRSKAKLLGLRALIDDILNTTSYFKIFDDLEKEEREDKIANVQEFINKVVEYENTTDDPSLEEFLEEIALVSELDKVKNDANCVMLMTLHSAKGLEFPYVYLAGAEDGVFPSYMTITSDDDMEIEEERRLAYVGITRAKEYLTITCARQRMIRGETQYNRVSKFVKEIPDELLDMKLPDAKLRDFESYSEKSPAKTLFRQNPYSNISYNNNRPKASFKPVQTPEDKKPFISKGIQGINQISGVSKGAEFVTSILEYEVGDRVKHVKFGTGLVTDIEKGKRDYQVTIDFDEYGIKTMLAAFAKLKKI